MSAYLEGPIYGPLTQREASLVERTYMGALLAKEIMASIDNPFEGWVKAGKATHDESQNPTEADEFKWAQMNYLEMRRHDKAAGGRG